jgi:hypothetical protein
MIKKQDKSFKRNLDKDDLIEERVSPGLHKKVQKMANKENHGKFKKLTHKLEHRLEEKLKPGVHKAEKKLEKKMKKK